MPGQNNDEMATGIVKVEIEFCYCRSGGLMMPPLKGAKAYAG
jgi:hypothetical protein